MRRCPGCGAGPGEDHSSECPICKADFVEMVKPDVPGFVPRKNKEVPNDG